MDGEAAFHQPNLSVKRVSARVPDQAGRCRSSTIFAVRRRTEHRRALPGRGSQPGRQPRSYVFEDEGNRLVRA